MKSFNKIRIITVVLLLLGTAQFYALDSDTTIGGSADPNMAGVWEGALNVNGTNLRLVLHIIADEDGKLKASMDSPDQGVSEMQVDEIWVKDNELSFVVMSIAGGYKGQIAKDNSVIDGTWKQGSSSFPLVLKKNPNRKARVLKERTEITVDPSIYSEYTGRYQIQPNFILTVTTRDERLFVQATAQPQIEVYPESETEFFYKVVNAQITFVKNEAGYVNKLILRQNGRDTEAKKMDVE
jgi:hypothetical protein